MDKKSDSQGSSASLEAYSASLRSKLRACTTSTLGLSLGISLRATWSAVDAAIFSNSWLVRIMSLRQLWTLFLFSASLKTSKVWASRSCFSFLMYSAETSKLFRACAALHCGEVLSRAERSSWRSSGVPARQSYTELSCLSAARYALHR